MLAQVNARMEAQRRERGGVLGSWGSSENPADQDAVMSGGTAYAIAQSEMRNLAEHHGIVVRFVDEGAASGVAQVRALARAHGIRIQILGEDGEEGQAPFGGNGVAKAVGGDMATPPPILSSLRTRATSARRSPSPVLHTLMQVRYFEVHAIPFLLAWPLVRVGRRRGSVQRFAD